MNINAVDDIIGQVHCTDINKHQTHIDIKQLFSIVRVWEVEPNESKTKPSSTLITILPLCWDLKISLFIPPSHRPVRVHQHFPAPGGKGHISNKQASVISRKKAPKKMKPILNPTATWLSYIACKVQ